MSCQVKLSAVLQDVPAIRRHLFPTDDLRGSDAWLQQCHVSVCPTGDLIVFGRERRLVVLTAKWDSSTGLNQFYTTYAGTLEENDIIKAVLCLPIVGQSQSSHVGPDWTCIVVGFESGYVRFYTETCNLLLFEQLHNEHVCSLKCQSQHSPRPDINKELRVEELYVCYPSCACVISGCVVLESLRNCRSQLAIILAKGGDFIPLEASTFPRKLAFQDQVTVNDVAVVGLDLTNTYDHLLTASNLCGFEARYRAMPPHNTLVLGAGSKPCLGFHYALDGGTQPVLSDVAKAVASKLKSALPGWLTGSKVESEKQHSAVLQQLEPLSYRFGLHDNRRYAISSVLSPDHQFAAVSDSLGRVLLVDTNRGVTTRIFKGYREAQCAFLQVPDEKKSKHKGNSRTALYLVIYSGKRGTLEIFSLQKGQKVVTFTASKSSRLFYIGYGLIGFVAPVKSRYICSYTCVLVDNDGKVKEIVVPFHFAFSEKNCGRIRDLHLYKRLKQVIKAGDDNCFLGEAINTCRELQTTEMKLQCIDILISSEEVKADVILSCVQYFLETLDCADCDNNIKHLLTVCKNLQKLLKFYVFITSVDLEEEIENSDLAETNQISTSMELNCNLQKLLDISTVVDIQKLSEFKVTFTDERSISVSKFISLFELNLESSIPLKNDLDEKILYNISSALFKKYISTSLRNPDALKIEVTSSGIATDDLFKLLLIYWVNKPLSLNINLDKEMKNLSCVILTLAQVSNLEDTAVDYNYTSQFWSKIREMLEDTSRPFPALIAAIVCQHVVRKIEEEKETQISDDSSEMWEKLTQENCQWNLLIGKLEDISLLNIILAYKLNIPETKLPRLKHISEDISLKFVLRRGRGCVSELIAKWLTSGGVDPEDVLINDMLYEEHTKEISVSNKEIEDSRIEQIKKLKAFEYLNLLKKVFPYSLRAELLLCNMSWEYAVTWSKAIEDITYLRAAVMCLKQIPDAYIKQGLSALLWNTHIKVIFENCCKLLNKVGKLPKPKLCQQDTKFNEVQIVQFLEICYEFLDDFIDTIQNCCKVQRSQLQYEPIFETVGRPLAELALQHDTVNYELLHLHYQLNLALLLMASFEVKHNKPLNNLFPTSANNVFFSDITKGGNIYIHSSDQKIIHSQTQFLFKLISASIESITVNNGVIYSTTHVNAMAKCLTLARMWKVDADLFKRYQIIQLITNGFDSLAEELFPSVIDKKELGPSLLAVAGKRLNQYLSCSAGLAEKVGVLSPTLTNYLQILNNDWCSQSSLDQIINLASLCLRCISEDTSEYKLNHLLLDACLALKDLEQS